MVGKQTAHAINATFANGCKINVTIMDGIAMHLYFPPKAAYDLYEGNKSDPNVKFIKPNKIIKVYPGRDWKDIMQEISLQFKKAGGKFKSGKGIING